MTQNTVEEGEKMNISYMEETKTFHLQAENGAPLHARFL